MIKAGEFVLKSYLGQEGSLASRMFESCWHKRANEKRGLFEPLFAIQT